MNPWASRVSELRNTGLTLAEIGRLVGLAPSTISDIEQARTAEPKGEGAVKLFELHKSRVVETKRKVVG